MSIPLIRYPLDPTGKNPNNAVIGEIRELSHKKVRAISPLYGPFFEEGLYLWDHITGRELVRGVDFELGQLEEFPTLRFGKGIYRLVLIINEDVSDMVRCNYQTLGGLYHFDSEGLAALYETIMSDDRPVSWINVVGKPEDYPPSPHQHLLREVYGFEPLMVSIERLAEAVTLGNTPAFNALVDWVERRVNNVETITDAEILADTSHDKILTYGGLLRASTVLNFNTVLMSKVKTTMYKGKSQTVELEFTNYDVDRVLFWSVEHLSSVAEDFVYTSGILQPTDGEVSFDIALTEGGLDEDYEAEFIVHIRRESSTGPILKSTPVITLKDGGGDGPGGEEPGEGDDEGEDQWGYKKPGLGGDGKWTGSVEDYTIRLQTACCIFDPYVGVHPHSLFLMINR